VGNNGHIITAGRVQKVGDNNWNSVVYANGKYVVVGSGYVTSSSDGLNWEAPKQISMKSHNWISVTYGNGKYVAVDQSDNYATTSVDGTIWTTPQKTEGMSGVMLSSVAFGNGRFVTIGNPNKIYYSTDGINWTVKYNSEPGFREVIYVNSLFLTLTSSIVMESVDGINWRQRGNHNTSSLNSIAYGNSKYIVVGENKFAISENVINWKVTLYYKSMNKIIFINDLGFVAVADNGYIIKFDKTANVISADQIKDESGNKISVRLNGLCAMPTQQIH